MQPLGQGRRKRAFLLATGQTTSYVDYDDGYYEKGIVKAYTVLTTGQYSGTTDITLNGKTDSHSNNCVFDNNTGLMWSRYVSDSVGPNSNGTLPFTVNVNGEGIFEYAAAANTASLGEHTGWRVPNLFEWLSIISIQTGLPNSTAFPSCPTWSGIWVSSYSADAGGPLHFVTSSSDLSAWTAGTATYWIYLVRG